MVMAMAWPKLPAAMYEGVPFHRPREAPGNERVEIAAFDLGGDNNIVIITDPM